MPIAFSSRAPHDTEPIADPSLPFWQSAPTLTMTGDAWGRETPGHASEIRSRWTASNLYFLFLCPYIELHLKPGPSLSAKTLGLWNWDVAEAFIGSVDAPLHRYREFEMSPQGEWLDLAVNLQNPDQSHDSDWSSGLLVAARIDPAARIWYGAMCIPFAAIEPTPPQPGRRYRINFFRSQGPSALEVCWQAPMQASFHAPERFGTLQLTI